MGDDECEPRISVLLGLNDDTPGKVTAGDSMSRWVSLGGGMLGGGMLGGEMLGGGKGPVSPEANAMWSAVVPLGRMGNPKEIRGLALLLASPAGSFMTGGVYPIDGGALLQGPSLPPFEE